MGVLIAVRGVSFERTELTNWCGSRGTPINEKESFALYRLPCKYCAAHPGTLRGTQVRVDIDSQFVVQAFDKVRSCDTHIHQLHVALFRLQVQEMNSGCV